MKTIKICFAAFAALMLTASCAKENVVAPEPAGAKLVVNAEFPETKTYIEKDGSVYKPFWQEGDEVAACNYGKTNPGYMTISELSSDGSKAIFTGSVPDIVFDGKTWINIRLLYPSSALSGFTGAYIELVLPEEQHPAANSFDPAADIMCSRASSQTSEYAGVTFKREMAVVRVNLKGTATFSKVSSLKMTVPGKKLAGSYRVETWDANLDMESTNTSKFDYVQAVYASGSERQVGVDGSNSIYLVVNPIEIAAGTEITFELETENGKVSKTVAVPDGGLSLTAGSVKPIGLTFTTAGKNVVTFDSNGGSSIYPATVNTGETVAAPADPTKAATGLAPLAAGLYEGLVDPDSPSYSFAGWYSDSALTQKYDFSTPVTSNITLYAKWVSPTPIDVVPEGGDKGQIAALAATYLNGLTLTEPTTYTIVITETNKYHNSIKINKEKVILYIIGRGKPCVIGNNWGENLMNVSNGNVFLGKNITITTTTNSPTKTYDAAINISGKSNVTMLEGSKIEGCTASWRASAVYLNDGNSSFTLDGGEICNNTVNSTSEKLVGTIAVNWGNVFIKKGKIHDNVVIANIPEALPSGGIMIPHDRTCEKTGGEIYDNTASFAEGVSGSYRGNNMVVATPSDLTFGVFVINDNIGESVTFKTRELKNTTPEPGSIWTRLN